MKNNRLNIPLFVCCIISPFVLSAQNEVWLANAQKILDNLYRAAGQYSFAKPTIKITDENKRVAAYIPAKNLITLDEKAYKICQSLGAEANNALAFLIGHELAHAFQKEVREADQATNFLNYAQHYHASERTEKTADIQGAFTSYLAGYGAKYAAPEILDEIYHAYGLDNVDLPSYPSKEERAASAKEVSTIIDDLIDLFEANKYLSLIGEHKTSSACLEHINEYYQGYEIDNNLGVTFLQLAIDDFFDLEKDIYAFPLVLNSSFQLEKINTSRGDVSKSKLSSVQLKIRNITIEEALKKFDLALQKDKKNTAVKLNRTFALNMRGHHSAAYDYLNSRSFSEKEKNTDAYQLALGLTEIFVGSKLKAASLFNDLKNSPDNAIATFAEHNHKVLQSGKTENYYPNQRALPEKLLLKIKEEKLGSTRSWHSIPLDEGNTVYFKKNKTGSKKAFSFGGQFTNELSFIVVEKPSVKVDPLDFQMEKIKEENGFYLMDKNANVIALCGNNGEVKRLVRYIEH